MKTLPILLLILAAGIFLLPACSKDEQEMAPVKSLQVDNYALPHPNPPKNLYVDWCENFDDASTLNDHWNLYGDRLPQWIFQGFNRYGLFDNNGPAPAISCAISKNPIGDRNGYTIESEVYVNVTNRKGTCICPGIGITRYLNQAPLPGEELETGISMSLKYVGEGVTSVPMEYRNHCYVQMSLLVENGELESPGEYAIMNDLLLNGWHRLKVVVDEARVVRFYVDDQLMWTPSKALDVSLMKDKNLLLGYTSSGNAGKAYHDWVKIIYRTPE